MAINVGAVFSVVELAKKMRNLKALIHVSTAYCNTHLAWWEMIRKSFLKIRTIITQLPKHTQRAWRDCWQQWLGRSWGNASAEQGDISLSLEIDSLNLLHILGFWMWIDIENSPLNWSIYLCRRWIQMCSIPWRASWLATDRTLTLTQRCIMIHDPSSQNRIVCSNKAVTSSY